MSYNPERELRKRKEIKKQIIQVSVISTYIGMWIGAEFVRYNNEFEDVVNNIINDFIKMRPISLGFIHKIPGCLCIFPTDFRFIFIAWFIALIYALTIYCDYLNNKNTRTGEEVDSAAFNIDYAKLERGYIMSPKYLTQGTVNGDIPISAANKLKFKIFVLLHPFSHLFKEKPSEAEEIPDEEQEAEEHE